MHSSMSNLKVPQYWYGRHNSGEKTPSVVTIRPRRPAENEISTSNTMTF
jgi:hypothetical protein